ncbi:Oidioi.mRNA.OKI2018_I69.chr1.g2495.t1.cds [Oikopleura dioica]|uniref:Tetraspanin n=1 Tax=Oikopleura dioica TaxID=34765 RepID=A0ABN7SR94_OIKDI|nr:Oidioi.mRNA.OKI2018_I69.chr1.g2495.t1.cds [Oikopleura dioica]
MQCKCWRFIFIALNFLVFLAGLLVSVASIWLLVSPDGLSDFVDTLSNETSEGVQEGLDDIITRMKGATYIFLALGILLAAISFLGFIGSIKRNRCMLNCFSIIMFLICAVEIVVMVVMTVFFPKFEELMIERFNNYTPETEEGLVVDQMQQLFQCCGWNNDSDFGANGPPLSCLNPALDPPVNFENGCKEYILDGTAIIWGVVVALVIIEVISITSACVFKNQNKQLA